MKIPNHPFWMACVNMLSFLLQKLLERCSCVLSMAETCRLIFMLERNHNIMSKTIKKIKPETKVCKKCGRELPLERFARSYKKYYHSVCKECNNAAQRVERAAKRAALRAEKEAADIEEYLKDKSLHLKRQYKKIDAWRVLSKAEHGFKLKASQEKFVKLLDYKETWVSSYGRVIIKDENGVYQLVQGKYTGAILYYTLDQNVYFKSKKEWGYRRQKVSASELVIQTFIVNHDMKNNTKCWHTDNNKRDNYYKHLYPVTDKQYAALVDLYRRNGTVTEAEVMQIVNAPEYKPDGWSAKYMKRSVCGVGYLAEKMPTDVYISDAYIRWANMIQRCYNKTVQKDKPYYKGKKVCEEWHNFQNFKIWYDKHMIPGAKVDLDKDLICKESNCYSPETCSFVSHYINTLFEDRGTKWIVEETKDGMYAASLIILKQKKKAGIYDTREAAEKAFYEYKKDHIVKIANKSKGKIPDYVYNAMLAWDVQKQCA